MNNVRWVIWLSLVSLLIQPVQAREDRDERNNRKGNQVDVTTAKVNYGVDMSVYSISSMAGSMIEQIEGRNYLLPVDATLNDGDKASQESLYLGDVLHAIERMRPKIAVVILDACRDNPFKDQKNSTVAKQGLARVDPPTSTVVFYATRPGGTAQDGDEDNGVFTKALLQEIDKPEQPLEVVFRRVSTSVFKSTKSQLIHY